MDTVMSIIFFILMFVVLGKLLKIAFKAAWNISAILGIIFFFPLIFIVLAFSGLLIIALPLLIIMGMMAFVFR